jgi:hypothetical protein
MQVIEQKGYYGVRDGQAAAMGAAVRNGSIVNPDLLNRLKGAEFGLWAAAAGMVGPALKWAKNKIGNTTAGKMIKDGWNQLRGRGTEVANSADDVAKGVANSADDVAKGVANSADDVAKGVSNSADDVAKAGSLASRAAGLKTLAGGVARVAVPVAVAIDVGTRAYDSYNIESKHDAIEKAHASGALSKEDMQKVTEERNAGHIRNGAGFAGGTAGALVGLKAGAAIGATAGVFTGPAAPVAVPVFSFLGGLGGGIAGYLYGSKAGEKVADTITGHDGSYAHTQRAMDTLEASKLAPRDEVATGEAWAKARERAVQSGHVAVPGQLQDPAAKREFAQNMGAGGINSEAVQVGVEQPTPAVAPLPRAKISLGAKTGARQSQSVSH